MGAVGDWSLAHLTCCGVEGVGDGLPGGGEEGGATDGVGLPLEGGDGLPGGGEDGDGLPGGVLGGGARGDGGPGDEGELLELRTLSSLWPATASASVNSDSPRTTVALRGMLPRTRPSWRH